MRRQVFSDGGILFALTFLLVSFFSIPGVLAAPQVSDVTVTDVTTRCFSVAWVSDVAATAGLRVFTDVAGSEEITDELKIEAHVLMCGDASIREAAENAGVMKVRALGGQTRKLDAGQTLYVQTVTTDKSSGEITEYPAPGNLVPVTLELKTVRTRQDGDQILPMTNDLLSLPGYACDGSNPASGALVVVSITGSDYPISSFIGDCIDAPHAFLDLNNVFGSTETMELAGTERTRVRLIRGREQGSLESMRRVPNSQGKCELKEMMVCTFEDGVNSDVNADDTVNILDLLTVAGVFGTQLGDCDFNPFFDVNPAGDEVINILDLLAVATHFGDSPVCPE